MEIGRVYRYRGGLVLLSLGRSVWSDRADDRGYRPFHRCMVLWNEPEWFPRIGEEFGVDLRSDIALKAEEIA